jgi:hypothetical protein
MQTSQTEHEAGFFKLLHASCEERISVCLDRYMLASTNHNLSCAIQSLTWISVHSINKTSSAELSEAINSMFQRYQNADVCYAYLVNVQTVDLNRSVLTRWRKLPGDFTYNK